MVTKIVLTVVYALLVLTLVILKAFKIGSRRRGVVKMLTASMFVGIAIYGCILQQGNLDIVLAVGLIFATLGDLLLVFMDRHSFFDAGVVSFAVASTVISAYGIAYFGFSWWMILPFALFVATTVICQVTKLYSFGRDIVYLNVYTLCIGLCGSVGIAVACTFGGVKAILFGIGSFMYMLSDVCLGLFLLKFKKVGLDIVNTLLYFPGMLLIALSLLF